MRRTATAYEIALMLNRRINKEQFVAEYRRIRVFCRRWNAGENVDSPMFS